MPAQPLLEDARQGSAKDPAPAIAIRIPVRSIGFAILGLVALLMIALASWNVDDPSFSYATSAPARNWLGFPGAVIADISFQVLGLGIIAFLVPPALWGWSFMRRRVPSAIGLRLMAWIAATVLATGVLAAITALVFSLEAVWVAHLLLGSLLLSQVLSFVLQLVYYRRGV